MPHFARNVLALTTSLLCSLVVASTSLAQTPQCGDLDKSGAITSNDALVLLKVSVGQQIEISCPTGLNCWDANSNSTCDE